MIHRSPDPADLQAFRNTLSESSARRPGELLFQHPVRLGHADGGVVERRLRLLSTKSGAFLRGADGFSFLGPTISEEAQGLQPAGVGLPTTAEALVARLSAMGEILDVVLTGGSFGGYAKLSCCSGHVTSASEGTPV
jgi:hypothetical protein